jgi:hypothetical protein
MPAINGILGVQKDFTLKWGETWLYSSQITDINAAPMDLSSVDMTGEIREGFKPDSKVVKTFLKGAEITYGGAVNSFYSHAVQLDFSYKLKYYYDIIFTMPVTGTVVRIFGILNFPKPIPQ